MKSLCGKRSLAAHRRKGVHNRGFTSGRKGRDWSVIKIHNRAISKSCCCSSTSTSFRVGSYEERCQEEIRDVHLPDNDDDAWGPLGARWFLTGEYRCSGGGSLFTRNDARESWSFAVKEKLTSQFLIRFLNSFWNLCFSCLKCPFNKTFLPVQPTLDWKCMPPTPHDLQPEPLGWIYGFDPPPSLIWVPRPARPESNLRKWQPGWCAE